MSRSKRQINLVNLTAESSRWKMQDRKVKDQLRSSTGKCTTKNRAHKSRTGKFETGKCKIGIDVAPEIAGPENVEPDQR